MSFLGPGSEFSLSHPQALPDKLGYLRITQCKDGQGEGVHHRSVLETAPHIPESTTPDSQQTGRGERRSDRSQRPAPTQAVDSGRDAFLTFHFDETINRA
jgi:hypothetical protein